MSNLRVGVDERVLHLLYPRVSKSRTLGRKKKKKIQHRREDSRPGGTATERRRPLREMFCGKGMKEGRGERMEIGEKRMKEKRMKRKKRGRENEKKKKKKKKRDKDGRG